MGPGASISCVPVGMQIAIMPTHADMVPWMDRQGLSRHDARLVFAKLWPGIHASTPPDGKQAKDAVTE